MSLEQLSKKVEEFKSYILGAHKDHVHVAINPQTSMLSSFFEPHSHTVVIGARELLEGSADKDEEAKKISSFFTVLGHELGHAKRHLEGKISSYLYPLGTMVQAGLSVYDLISHYKKVHLGNEHYWHILASLLAATPTWWEEFRAHKDVQEKVNNFLINRMNNKYGYNASLRNAALSTYLFGYSFYPLTDFVMNILLPEHIDKISNILTNFGKTPSG